jgi:hypothetical protein
MRLCGALALSLAIGLIVFAQQPRPGGMGKGGGAAFLLMNKSVQEEIKLTEDQVKTIGEAQAKQREMFGKFKDMTQEEKQDAFKKLGEETDKFVKDLKPEQSKRLREIQLQQVGPQVFANEDMQKAVGLTEADVKKVALTADQKDKFKDLGEAMMADMKELPKGFDADTQKKRQALTKEYKDKAIAVLTSEQRKVWEEMAGKPFEIKMENPFGKGKNKPSPD